MTNPLILSFSPVGLCYRPSDPEVEIRVISTGIDIVNKLRILGIKAYWDLWPDYLVHAKRIELRVRRDGYVAVAPRFDDRAMCLSNARKGCSKRLLDLDYGKRVFESEWQWILKNLSKVRIIIAIYSWNEYHERSEIEPHIDATAKDGTYPYEVVEKFAKQIKSIA